jgi:hypothetical protein
VAEVAGFLLADINGFELRRQVERQIHALRREKGNVRFPGHLEEIDRQLAIFEAELERMVATGEGEEDEPEPPKSAWTQTAWLGGPLGQAWTPHG